MNNTQSQCWSEGELADILVARSHWCEEQQEMVTPISVMIELAYDPRTPDSKAAKLHKIVQQWGATGQTF